MLLARKGTEERNISYGYSVLSRIPPGEIDNVSKAAGFKYDIISYFYDNKGDVTGLPQEDQDKLWIFFAEAGASIAIPDKATKGEWVDARRSASKPSPEQALKDVDSTKQWRDTNATFKFINRYQYLKTIADLQKLLKDEEITPDEVDQIKSIMGVQ